MPAALNESTYYPKDKAMTARDYPLTKRRVMAFLKAYLPGLETVGVRDFRQLARLIEQKEEEDFQVPLVDPVPPPERSVRVVHASHTVKVPKPVVLVDTREQEGFAYTFERFSKWFAGVERATLRVGDYSIKGMEGRLAIERKSLPDLVNSVIGDRARFLAQAKRLASLERKAIVVEASLAKVKSPYPESQAHPNAVVGTLMALQERWGIQILWCDNAELAEETVAHILSKSYTLQWLKAHRRPRHFVDGDI
jgi:DNA excision repair protein ERCC-4